MVSSSSPCCGKQNHGSSSSTNMTLDLNLGTAHLMDIIEDPSGINCESILIRYQAPCAMEDLLEEVNNNSEEYAAAAAAGDDQTTKSSSVASTSLQKAHSRQRRRRRQQQQRLDDLVWFLVASIASSPCSKEFKRLSLRFVGCTFPADALAWLLERSPQVESLQMRVQFHGSLRLLGKTLKRHPSLNNVWLDNCRPSLDEDDLPIRRKRTSSDKSKKAQQQQTTPTKVVATLEPLLDGLSRSRTLRSLTLSHSVIAVTIAPKPTTTFEEEEGEDPMMSQQQQQQQPCKPDWNAGASLVKFAQMPSLRKLSLECMSEVRDCDLAAMADALQNHHYMTSLSIRQCAVGPLAGQAMGRMLSHNRGLQTLDCNMHWWDGMSYEETPVGEYVAKCWEADVIPLVRGLATNSTLKCLGLYCDNLAYNQSAAVVSVLGEYVEANTQQLCATVLEEMPNKIMQTNSILEDLIVGHRSFGLTPEIDFYLKWNRSGRHYFYRNENATRHDYMDAILNHRDDLSVVYALVSMNPMMFGQK